MYYGIMVCTEAFRIVAFLITPAILVTGYRVIQYFDYYKENGDQFSSALITLKNLILFTVKQRL